ncbi:MULTISPECIES: YbaB/EbfC family nucleoid-associated protein [Amycolatopsis]|uniref:YbaB/EbfC DNA-binding family protein n=2 Tax=Amycolatopsis TaxID=1813 RepID=A0A1I3WYD6_9PSEU|nr:YbaB/EbfC family nucleoid-associated protein [Amycolatopsis sacchari]SFK12149.1 YbaB/EbfC DNA-binding family protein [Amycolatopsis sacchari]
MADWTGQGELDAAMSLLEKEQRRLKELSRMWQEERTTVHAKDRSLSMTFDGRGELVDMAFNGSKYRTIAPAELAHLIVETLRQGRAQSVEKMSRLMGSDALPGVDIAGLATGKVDVNEVLESLVAPMLNGVADDGVLGKPARRTGETYGG